MAGYEVDRLRDGCSKFLQSAIVQTSIYVVEFDEGGIAYSRMFNADGMNENTHRAWRSWAEMYDF